MELSKRESAVSPVIGTILLVAITVVLVAIVAAVVMGMSGDVGKAKSIGLTVEGVRQPIFTGTEDEPHPYYVVRIYGGSDVANLKYLNLSVEGTPGAAFVGTTRDLSEGINMDLFTEAGYPEGHPIPTSDLVGLGLRYLPFGSIEPGVPTLITVTGTFSDGSEQILYSGKVPFPVYDVDSYELPHAEDYQEFLDMGFQNSPWLT
jgi:flagellin-like protein